MYLVSIGLDFQQLILIGKVRDFFPNGLRVAECFFGINPPHHTVDGRNPKQPTSTGTNVEETFILAS